MHDNGDRGRWNECALDDESQNGVIYGRTVKVKISESRGGAEWDTFEGI